MPQTQPSESSRRLVRRDDGDSVVIPIQESNLKKIEDFIQSKVQPGTRIARITNENQITAWFNLHFDS